MNKVNPFHVVPFPLIFLSNIIVAFGVIFLPNPGKLTLVMGIATFVSAFCLN